MEKNLELRMYGLVNYQLTGIQKGIQFLHGVVEYSQMANRIGGNVLDVYNNWANNYKTVILLNGGTTNKSLLETGIPFGTLNQHLLTLTHNGIELAFFEESDLGDQLTTVVFIVDERVFNKKDYLDFGDWVVEKYGYDYLNIETSDSFLTPEKIGEIIKNSTSDSDKKIYQNWLNLIGGEKNLFLRDFLKKFKLA
jgi:hypothetical protein